MPAKVANVAWKCPQCGKRKWLKPSVAKNRKACSRACGYASNRVETPVRAKPGRKLARYGERACPACQSTFEAKYPSQVYCSQECVTIAVRTRKIVEHPDPRPCESCGQTFTPRRGSAGRFCSRTCTYAGQSGAAHQSWKGGRYVRSDGYVMVRVAGHPSAQQHHDYVPEHRLVMEKTLGRYLEAHETVHHINGVRDDNRTENLQLRSGRHGKGAAYQCLDCGSTNVAAATLKES